METNGFNIFFQEDEEDYLDDHISLLDIEEHTVFTVFSEKYLENITIEDPGYVVNISVEDYELQLQRSLSNLMELKKAKESSGYSNNNDLLRKCRTFSIKVVDCHKFPWYYRNKLGSTNKTHYPDTEDNVVEIDEKDEEEIMIIDLTENEHVECKNRNDNIIQEEYTNNIDKVKANRTEFRSLENSIDGKVRKQTYQRLSKPVLDIQKESHAKTPTMAEDQATDLIISTYTSLTDKAIQKLKRNIESCENNKNISHNLGRNLLLGCNCFIDTRETLNNTKNVEKVAKVTIDDINNDCKDVYKKKNNKKINKLKSVYISEQISKTKIKIKKSSLKSNDIISSKNNYNDIEGKGCNLNLNTTNREQHDLKNIEKNHNSLNEKQRNREQNCYHQNKQERIQRNSYSYLSLPSPVLTTIITETKKSTSLSDRNNFNPDKIYKCNKQVYSADKIIPHFHDNSFINHRNILSKTKSNTKRPKRSKNIINNYETKRTKNIFDSKDLNKNMVTQIPNSSIDQRINDYCLGNNAIINDKVTHKIIYNRNMDISNNSTINSVNPYQFNHKLPINNGITLKRSTQASSNVVKENLNNVDLINQSKKNVAQEEERLRYLLPSNFPDSRIQNIFSNYDDSNLINLP